MRTDKNKTKGRKKKAVGNFALILPRGSYA